MVHTNDAPEGRRRFLATALAALGGLIAGRARAQAPAALSSGAPLTTHMRQGNPPAQPLDTMVLFERGDDSNGRAMTHEVLSLIHEEKGKRSFPWTMYASLATHHDEGDACVVCSRLHDYGKGWSTGLHSEVFNHGPATALGVNIEMSSDYSGAAATNVIGLNIQAVGGPAPMQYGIQVHDSGGRFRKGIGLNGHGETGLDLAGEYKVGIDAHANSIRLAEGACIELDGKGQIRLRYHKGRIEFLNGDRCFGHLDVDGEDHAV